jgi:hypothetical protein
MIHLASSRRAAVFEVPELADLRASLGRELATVHTSETLHCGYWQ